MIDVAQRPHYLAVVEQALRVHFSPAEVVTLTSVGADNNILGVVLFSRFSTCDCEITVVGQAHGWLTRKLIVASALYAFRQMSLRRITAHVAVGNQASLNLAQRLGFRIEGEARDWFPDSNALVLSLLRDECKWIKDENGQPFRPSDT